MTMDSVISPWESVKSTLAAYMTVVRSAQQADFPLPVSEKLDMLLQKNGKKIKIAFLGGYSAGKTTFISRGLGKLATNSSPVPETATEIVHKAGTKNLMRLNFKDEYIDEVGDFYKTLKSLSLEDAFEQVAQGKFRIKDRTLLTFENDNTGILIDFFAKIKKHSSSIENVEISHIVGARHQFLNYADIVDLPGIGGTEHHDKTINNFLEKLIEFDIVIYVIDTARGIIDSDELELLNRLINQLFNKIESNELKWWWLFQKKSDGKLDSLSNFLQDKKEDLGVLFSENTNTLLFDFFEKSNFISAFGDKNEHSEAKNALLFLIMSYIDDVYTSIKPTLRFEKIDSFAFRFIENKKNNTILEYIKEYIERICENGDIDYTKLYFKIRDDLLKLNRLVYRESDQVFFDNAMDKIKRWIEHIVSNVIKTNHSGFIVNFLMEHKRVKNFYTNFNYIKNEMHEDFNKSDAFEVQSLLYCLYFLHLHKSNELPSLFTNNILSEVDNALGENHKAFRLSFGNAQENVNYIKV